MPKSILLSGPAGANKSALARELLEKTPGPVVIADFQSIYAALVHDIRGRDGRYPLRDMELMPITEYTRQAIISGARQRDITIIATNSDGDPARRAALLERLGPGATERIVDPGRHIVEARLSSAHTGELSDACDAAISRWYDRR